MRRSQYCLCPGGVEGWSLRVLDAVHVGCVPVLMSDRTELPYEGPLDWSKFTVKAAEATQGDGRGLLDLIFKLSSSPKALHMLSLTNRA
jgi:hypothetical protein